MPSPDFVFALSKLMQFGIPYTSEFTHEPNPEQHPQCPLTTSMAAREGSTSHQNPEDQWTNFQSLLINKAPKIKSRPVPGYHL